MDGRAVTAEEKRAIVERILRAWQANPHLRLGQLIANAMAVRGVDARSRDLFYVEDEAFAFIVALFGSRPSP